MYDDWDDDEYDYDEEYEHDYFDDDYCYECVGYGELESACPTCPHNRFREDHDWDDDWE